MPDEKAVIVVLGRDADGKPRAARFAEADQATNAAKALGYRAVRATDPELLKLTGELGAARAPAGGNWSLPVVKQATYEKLAALIGTAAELKPETTTTVRPTAEKPATQGDKRPEPPERANQPKKSDQPPGAEQPPTKQAVKPADPWEAIGAGSVVLVYDRDDEAWYEAVVRAVAENRTLTARWRDYPGFPLLTVAVDRVGLIKPAAR